MSSAEKGPDSPDEHFLRGADYDAAVSSLQHAATAAPHRPEAHYYLGAAIRARVKRESEDLGRALDAFSTYLELGAPLGHREEIDEFLADRRARPDRRPDGKAIDPWD